MINFRLIWCFNFFIFLCSVEYYYIEYFYVIFMNSNLMDEKLLFRGIKILELFLIDKLIL